MLIRNFAGVQGLGPRLVVSILFRRPKPLRSLRLGQYRWSFDGVMVQYSHSIMDTHAGWFPAQPKPTSSKGPPSEAETPSIGGTGQARNAAGDTDLFIFDNQIKAVPGFLIEPFYVYYKNNLGGGDISGQGLGLPSMAIKPAIHLAQESP